MEKISSNQKHDGQTFLYAGARAIERASFYGFRSIITLYMVHRIGISEKDASIIYGAFIGSFMISQIFGALLGDLLIGNKKAMLFGGMLQALGAFILCIPSTLALYTGLVVTTLGIGLFSPNILSTYGKLFLNKFKLIDSAFTIFYVAVNVGAFIGILLISSIGDPNYTLGFITVGVLMVVSVIILFLSKTEEIIIIEKNSISVKNRIFKIFISILCLGIFWRMFMDSGYKLSLIENQLQNVISGYKLQMLNPFFVTFFGCIAGVAWSFFYVPQLKKWAAGFLLAGAAYGVFLLMSDGPSYSNLFIYGLSTLLLSVAEILIAPVLYSILAKNTKPKYLAIAISFAAVPSTFIQYFIGTSASIYIEKFAFQLGAIILGGIGMMILIYILIKKPAPVFEENVS